MSTTGLVHDHLERLRIAVLRRHSMANLADWIEKNTTLGGQPYSFFNHEFQRNIVSDTSAEIAVRKCSQVGVSEATVRLALAMVNVIAGFTAIYTLPTAKFSSTFTRTRVDPVIAGSKTMKEAVHRTNDNSELKQFNDSFLYLKGAASTNAPISIPADAVISDETDFSDQEVLSQYTSRLTHSPWQLIRKFSTPTLPGFGVDRAFQNSRRHFNLCKCNHCNHWFMPDYYSHVKIPDYTGELREITKQTLARIRWQEAVLICPSCGKVPSLQIQHREYVCENPNENLIGAGYQVTPFDAPNIIKVSYLVKSSTDYDRAQDFVNFGLGLPMEDSEATLTRSDLLACFGIYQMTLGVVYVMGVDVGNTYHFVIGAVNGYGHCFVVHAERVPMGKAKVRYNELRKKFGVICTVMDSGPHAETVMSLQAQDSNMYAAVYVRSKSLLTHVVVDKDKDHEEGKDFVRQVNVNRSRAFDDYMNAVREGKIGILEMEHDDKEVIIDHHCSMKRVKVYDNDSAELSYSWEKTDGEDHFHHAFGYMWIASKIRGVGRPLIALTTTGVQTFRLKPKLPVR